MATLERLVREGDLCRYHVDLEHPDVPERYIYTSRAFEAWVVNTLANAPRDRGRNLNPLEQVDECLFEFIKGEKLTYGAHCRKLRPLTDHIWELKTTDVRIFGWFPRNSTFLITEGEMKAKLRNFQSYEPYVTRAVEFRQKLQLDPPKSLIGGMLDVF